MSEPARFLYGFEYEEHADDFLAKVTAIGFDAVLEAREDGIEAVAVAADATNEAGLDAIASQAFGYSLGGRPNFE